MLFISKYNMTREQNIFAAKRNIVDYIWKSANLEGIGVTYPDTQAIYNGMSVSGYSIDEINAVNDLKEAWRFVLDNLDSALDIEYIKNVHRILGRFTVANSGCLRSHDVNIGGTDWVPDIPDESKVADELSELMEKAQSDIDRALDVTLFLMRAQLFYDGNKRLAMLVGNKLMINSGEGIISVKQKDIKDFYSLLVPYYETGQADKIKRFIYENCIDGMEF